MEATPAPGSRVQPTTSTLATRYSLLPRPPAYLPPAGPPTCATFRRSRDATLGNTQIWWNAALTNTAATATNDVAIYILRKKAALFGVQAPNPFLLPKKTLQQIPGNPLSSTTTATTSSLSTLAGAKLIVADFLFASPTDWIFTYAGGGVINLDAAYTGLAPAGSSADQLQWLVLTGPPTPRCFRS